MAKVPEEHSSWSKKSGEVIELTRGKIRPARQLSLNIGDRRDPILLRLARDILNAHLLKRSLDVAVNELPLQNRIKTILADQDICTVEELLWFPDEAYRDCTPLGYVSLREIDRALATVGAALEHLPTANFRYFGDTHVNFRALILPRVFLGREIIRISCQLRRELGVISVAGLVGHTDKSIMKALSHDTLDPNRFMGDLTRIRDEVQTWDARVALNEAQAE